MIYADYMSLSVFLVRLFILPNYAEFIFLLRETFDFELKTSNSLCWPLSFVNKKKKQSHMLFEVQRK